MCDLSVYRILQISLFICTVSPYLDQVFRCVFSMDNLRGYGEDEPSSSAGLGPSAAQLPSSTEGPSAPLQAQASVMAGSSPAIVPVTSGPVPTVSAQSQPALSVPQDSVPTHFGLLDDLLPPPPPAEPYVDFLARVGRELSSLPGQTTQPAAALPPRASVTALTTGTRLPTPFPRLEDSSWALQAQVPNPRIRMPLPTSCYTAPPSPWVWPGRGSAAATSLVRVFLPASLPAAPTGPFGPPGRFAGPFPGGPSPVPPPSVPALDQKMTSSTPPPRFRGFFFGCHAPFYPHHWNICVIVFYQCELCHSNDDTAGYRDHFPGTYPGDDPRVERRVYGDMKSFWTQFVGDAPPQQTVGPAVPPGNMGSDSLQQLSPSDDREASRAQRKAGSKRAGNSVRRRNRSSERSSTDRQRAWVRRHQMSPDSSSPTRRLSPPAKTLTMGQAYCLPWDQLIRRSSAISTATPSLEISLTTSTPSWFFTFTFTSPQVQG